MGLALAALHVSMTVRTLWQVLGEYTDMIQQQRVFRRRPPMVDGQIKYARRICSREYRRKLRIPDMLHVFGECSIPRRKTDTHMVLQNTIKIGYTYDIMSIRHNS